MIYKAPMDRIGVSYAFNVDKFASGYYDYSSYPYPETPLGDKIRYYIEEFIDWTKCIAEFIYIGLCLLCFFGYPLAMLIILILKLMQKI